MDSWVNLNKLRFLPVEVSSSCHSTRVSVMGCPYFSARKRNSTSQAATVHPLASASALKMSILLKISFAIWVCTSLKPHCVSSMCGRRIDLRKAPNEAEASLRKGEKFLRVKPREPITTSEPSLTAGRSLSSSVIGVD